MAEQKFKVAGVRDLREILEEQNYKCAITGRELTPDTTAFDHIVPMSQGGSSEKFNLQAVIRQVNTSKGEMTMREYIDLCAEVISNIGFKYGYSILKTAKKTG